MKNQFNIKTVTNPGGSQSFFVSGTLNRQVRKRQFKTELEAMTCKQNWEREAANIAPLPTATTRLTLAQCAEAEACFHRLAGHPLGSLTAAVDWAVRNYVASEKSITVRETFPLFMEDKKRSRQGGLAKDTVDKLTIRLRRVLHAVGDKLIHEVTAEDLKPLIFRENSGDVNRHSDYTTFSNFFNWAVWREFRQDNPCKKIQRIKLDFGEPVVLSLAHVRSLVVAAQTHECGSLVPFLALALFCGMRVKEIARLQQCGGWDNIDLEAKTINVGPKVAKGRSRRVVAIPDNALAFLLPHVVKRSLFIVANHRRRLEAIRKLAGLGEWKKDVLRHTAITYRLAQTDDENKTAAWAGNSPNIIHKHYRGIVKASDVPEFWRIEPGMDSNIVKLEQKAAA